MQKKIVSAFVAVVLMASSASAQYYMGYDSYGYVDPAMMAGISSPAPTPDSTSTTSYDPYMEMYGSAYLTPAPSAPTLSYAPAVASGPVGYLPIYIDIYNPPSGGYQAPPPANTNAFSVNLSTIPAPTLLGNSAIVVQTSGPPNTKFWVTVSNAMGMSIAYNRSMAPYLTSGSTYGSMAKEVFWGVVPYVKHNITATNQDGEKWSGSIWSVW